GCGQQDHSVSGKGRQSRQNEGSDSWLTDVFRLGPDRFLRCSLCFMKKSQSAARTPHSNESFQLGNSEVPPGKRQHLEIPLARLPSETWLSLPAEVVNGAHAGPLLWLSA